MFAHTPLIPMRSVIRSGTHPSRLSQRIAPRPSIQRRHFSGDPGTTMMTGLAVAGAGIGAVAALISRYKVSEANQYIAWTGLGITDITISKKGFQFPFQTYHFINMHPSNYTFNLHAMSSEKLEFQLPIVLTIGVANKPEALEKYARTLIGTGENSKQIEAIILGILEGEVRILASSLTVEQIFADRLSFKNKIVTIVAEELSQFGLEIYNANIKELQDSPGSEYFSFVRQKKRSESESKAKVEISEATKTGNIGAKEREATTRQEVIRLEAETVDLENQRRQGIEKSSAELDVVKAEAYRRREVAKTEAEMATQMRLAELQKEVEKMKIATKTEELRAIEMSKAQVHAEMAIKKAEGDALSSIKKAEGEANALRLTADASRYAKEQEAEGIRAFFEAQSDGLRRLRSSFGNDASTLQFLMMDKGILETLARANAEAVKGMNPKITVWNTSSDGKSDYTKTDCGCRQDDSSPHNCPRAIGIQNSRSIQEYP